MGRRKRSIRPYSRRNDATEEDAREVFELVREAILFWLYGSRYLCIVSIVLMYAYLYYVLVEINSSISPIIHDRVLMVTHHCRPLHFSVSVNDLDQVRHYLQIFRLLPTSLITISQISHQRTMEIFPILVMISYQFGRIWD